MKEYKVGVLMGGLSSERDISLRSGEAVYQALLERGYEVIRIDVDERIDQTLRREAPDIAFVALHGTYGEDGCVQGLLELLGIPYTGSGVTASALAMDKVHAKQLFRFHNVPTPAYYSVREDQLEQLENLHSSFGFPVYVKPRHAGSSLGGGRAGNLSELKAAIEGALQYDEDVLVERFVAGREVTVGVLGGKPLGLIEVQTASGVYDYEAKYESPATRYVPFECSPTRKQCLMNLAARAVSSLGVTGAARVDFLVSDRQNEFVLEVNSVPGLLPTSLLPKSAAEAGMSYGDLCEEMLKMAKLHQSKREASRLCHGPASDEPDAPSGSRALAVSSLRHSR